MTTQERSLLATLALAGVQHRTNNFRPPKNESTIQYYRQLCDFLARVHPRGKSWPALIDARRRMMLDEEDA
jgi:hypothetical protein